MRPGQSRQEQEISLGITLVAVSVLFIACQSVKIVPDLYELIFCGKHTEVKDGGTMECPSTRAIDGIIR